MGLRGLRLWVVDGAWRHHPLLPPLQLLLLLLHLRHKRAGIGAAHTASGPKAPIRARADIQGANNTAATP